MRLQTPLKRSFSLYYVDWSPWHGSGSPDQDPLGSMSKKKTQSPENGAETVEAPGATAEAPDNGAGAPAPSQASPMSPFGDLDQVRQILFGAESQQINTRLIDLEKHFSGVIDALKDSVDHRFKAMEASVKKQNDALSKRLADEKDQRKEADTGLSKDLRALTKDLEKNRAQLDEVIAKTEQALRTALQDEADKAAKDRAARHEELSARLEQAVAELSDAKTDRHSLADLLDQLSAGLRNGQ